MIGFWLQSASGDRDVAWADTARRWTMGGQASYERILGFTPRLLSASFSAY